MLFDISFSVATVNLAHAHVQVSPDPGFPSGGTTNVYGVLNQSSHIVGANVSHNDYVRARLTTGPGGTGVASSWGTVTRFVIPPVPTGLASDATGIVVDPESATVFLHVQVSSGPTFSGPSNLYGNSGAARAILTNLAEGSYLRARFTTLANGGGIPSDWSDPIQHYLTPAVPTGLTFD